jgi:hypothetical protein
VASTAAQTAATAVDRPLPGRAAVRPRPPDLGGLSGADAICNARAAAASLPGTYRAYLSDSSVDAVDRLTRSSGQYKLVDGTVVANDFAQFFCPSPIVPINKTELNTTPPDTGVCGAPSVITGTGPGGRKYTNSLIVYHCADYTAAADGIHWGRWDTTAQWGMNCTGHGGAFCGAFGVAPIYCFQQ